MSERDRFNHAMHNLIVSRNSSGDYDILGATAGRMGLVGEAAWSEEARRYIVWLNWEGFFGGKVAQVILHDDGWRTEPEPGHEMIDDPDLAYPSVEDAIRAGVVALVKAAEGRG